MKRRIPDGQLKERDVAPEIAQAFASSGAHIFRNNIGCARFGERWVQYGVGGKGGPDHIGYLPVRVTQDMVGHYVAVFMCPESKRPVGGKYDRKQIEFRDNVLAAGGIAGFVRSWEEARALVQNFFARFPKKFDKRIKKQ